MDVFDEEYQKALDSQLEMLNDALGLEGGITKKIKFKGFIDYGNTIQALDIAIKALINKHETTTYVLMELRDKLK